MSDGEVSEKLLSDAFADRKTGRRVLQDMAKVNPTLVQWLAAFAFAQRILHSVQRLLHLQGSKEIHELQENYLGVRLIGISRSVSRRICAVSGTAGNGSCSSPRATVFSSLMARCWQTVKTNNPDVPTRLSSMCRRSRSGSTEKPRRNFCVAIRRKP